MNTKLKDAIQCLRKWRVALLLSKGVYSNSERSRRQLCYLVNRFCWIVSKALSCLLHLTACFCAVLCSALLCAAFLCMQLNKPSEPPTATEIVPLSPGEVYYEPTGGEPVTVTNTQHTCTNTSVHAETKRFFRLGEKWWRELYACGSLHDVF